MSISSKHIPYRLNPPDLRDFTEGFIRKGHANVKALDKFGRTVCVKRLSRRSLVDSYGLEFSLSTMYATPKAWDKSLGVVRIEVTLN